MEFDMDARARRRQYVLRNLPWMIPLGMVLGVGMFVGVGFLVAWLWRVTVGDIFGFKAISFWQAWGLILLSQFLFKANMQRSFPVSHRRRWGVGNGAPSPAGPQVGV